MSDKLLPDVLRTQKGISFVGITTSFVCHDGKGKIFMAQRSHKARDERGTWDTGGGGLKWGVAIEDNLRRELKEEYDAEALQIEYLGFREMFRRNNEDKSTHWISFDYAALVDPNKVRINEPDMFDDSGWFTINSLPDPLHSGFQQIVAKYASEWPRILGESLSVEP